MMAANNRATKKGFLGMSRRFIRKSLFIMIFALLGVGFTLYSRAATENSVRFVFLCASDRCDTSLGGTPTVDSRGYSVKQWYEDKLGGRTFRRLPTIKMTSTHSEYWYKTHGSYGSQALNTWYNIYYDKTDKYGTAFHEANVNTVFILGFHSMDHCGVGDANTAVVDPFQGCSTFQNSVYAHELGHTFGLKHTYDNTLMNDPAACGGVTLATCTMGSYARNYLLANKLSWFPATPNYVAGASSTPPPPPSSCNLSTVATLGTTLAVNQTLFSNQQLKSADGQYCLIMQPDGNLVLYSDGGKQIWISNTYGSGADRLVMQPDGNLVLYAGSSVKWESKTFGRGSDHLIMQPDSNAVLYTSGGTAVWSTSFGLVALPPPPPTTCSVSGVTTVGDRLNVNYILYANQQLKSADGQYCVTMQPDGNLALYSKYTNRVIWQSGTFNSGGTLLSFQPDQNLVIYDSSWNPKWWTGAKAGAYTLVMQSDGNLVMYNSSTWVWQSYTYGVR